MTTEAPDGPMPMCMSPESYRAAVDRAKKAERERDEALANVATLVEQLGEAERQAALYRADREGVYRNFERAMDERDDARRDRDRLLDALDANSMADGLARARAAAQPVVEPRDERVDPEVVERALTRMRGKDASLCLPGLRTGCSDFFHILEAIALDHSLFTAVAKRHAEHGYAPHPSGTEGPTAEMRDKALRFDLDQAGIESRERDAAMFVETRALLARIVKYAREDHATTPGFTRLARALTEAQRLLDAVAAQPVVEPRDGLREAMVPMNVDALCECGHPRTTHWNRHWNCQQYLAPECSCERYRPAGYAPHPSGTEGPLREARAALVRAEGDFAELRVSIGLKHNLLDLDQEGYDAGLRCSKAVDAIDAALAASPPDGTAPERAPTEEALRRLLDEELNVQRLSYGAWRVWDDSDAQLEGEGRTLVEALAEYDGARDEESDATRPPDGMPGESREAHVLGTRGDIRRADMCVLRACSHVKRVDGFCRYAPTRAEDREQALAAIENRAAPPTVPGEPPRQDVIDVLLGALIESSKDPLSQREAKLSIAMREAMHLCGYEPNAGGAHHNYRPPTPPLTPERAPRTDPARLRRAHTMHGDDVLALMDRVDELESRGAPLDEAAVRADERAKTELDIVAWMRSVVSDAKEQYREGKSMPDGFFLWADGIEARSYDIEESKYPRRSEGAG